MDARRGFLAGVKTATPLMVGIAPFGLVSGVAAVNAGLSPLQTMGLSVFVFAGTSQLAAIELVRGGAAAPVIVLTVFVVNVRMVMYSASIAPHLRELSGRWRSLLSYLLTDHVYALGVRAVEEREVPLRWYVLGVGATLWTVWQACTLAGIALGTTVPPRWGLEFVVPLTFLALLVPEIKERAGAGAAAVAGVVAVAGAGLPMNLGLVLGAVLGVLSGSVLREVEG
jgi:4-azaleucine resistance transporter AzlC